jgi:phosphatidylethanolamine/phosphatidyl-N-methylethanolamine N-methyltransferase
MRTWAEYKHFFREFRRDFHHTGAVLPSGFFLSQALVRPLRLPRLPAHILEVGPGTGSVTREIARRLQVGDRLDAVEINPRFAQMLEQKVRRDPLLSFWQDDIHVINAPVQDIIGESIYDFIISGLPLNNFTVAEIRSVFAAFTRLLRPGGTLVYFEYALVRQLKTPFVNRHERRRLLRVSRVVGRYIRQHQVRRERIFINVPPAIVRQLCLKPTSCESFVPVVSCSEG